MAEPIHKSPEELEEQPAERPLQLIGTPFRRVDGRAKVTGGTRFADDLTFPRMCYIKLVRSTVPHAKVLGVDFTAAAAVPGFLGSLVGAEMPIPFGILPVSQDEHALCLDKVRFVGDPVAAVAATTEDGAHEAALQVRVDYEPLTTIGSVEEALKTPEPRIHDYGDGGNVHKVVAMTFGDVDGGFAAADEIFEDTLFYEGNTHLPMEQHSAVAVPEDDDRVTLYSSTQTPHYVHRALAKVLGLPASRIRVIACSNGGGFGGKSDPFNHEIVAAKLALKLGRPAKVTPHPGGGLLLPPRPPSRPHAGENRDQARRRPGADHRPELEDGARRRRLRELRGGLDLLHRGAPDGDLQAPGLPLRRGPRLHQQAPLRPQARPRHAAAALRLRGPSRQDRREARDESGRPETPDARRARDHRQLAEDRLDGAPGLHRRGGQRQRLSRALGEAPPRPRPGARLRLLSLWRRPPHLLEPHAAVGGTAQARPLRRGRGLLRRIGDRPGVGLGARRGGRRGAGGGARGHPPLRRRYRSHPGRPRELLLAGHPDGGERRPRGGRARPRPPRPGGLRPVGDPPRPAGLRRGPGVRRRGAGEGARLRRGGDRRRGPLRHPGDHRLLHPAALARPLPGRRGRPLPHLLLLGVGDRGRGRSGDRPDGAPSTSGSPTTSAGRSTRCSFWGRSRGASTWAWAR